MPGVCCTINCGEPGGAFGIVSVPVFVCVSLLCDVGIDKLLVVCEYLPQCPIFVVEIAREYKYKWWNSF